MGKYIEHNRQGPSPAQLAATMNAKDQRPLTPDEARQEQEAWKKIADAPRYHNYDGRTRTKL